MSMGVLQPSRAGDREAGLAIRAQSPPSSEAPETISRYLAHAQFVFDYDFRQSSFQQPQWNSDVNQCRKLFHLIPIQSFISPAFVHRNPSGPNTIHHSKPQYHSVAFDNKKRRLPGIFQVGGASFRTVGHQAQVVRDQTRVSRHISRNNVAVISIRIVAASP